MPHIRALCQLGYEWGRSAFRAHQFPNDELFLRAAYRVLFKREPDREGYQTHLDELRHKHFTKLRVAQVFLESDEYKNMHGLSMHPLEAAHRTRIQFIQEYLPAADVIVDLGGAANESDAGALLMLGYPHHAQTIYIVDLPAEARFVGSSEPEQAAQSHELIARDGIKISYLYQSMSERLPLSDESVDLVFSGESIEHVTESEADAVCREAHRVLKQNGYFILDTPNAALTRIESPDELIHPEHKKEYYPHELRSKLEHWGFKIVDMGGICPMPDSLRTHTFSHKELVQRRGISNNPEEGYMFYLKAMKAASKKQ
jgi:SAM-dependent methyltransferase